MATKISITDTNDLIYKKLPKDIEVGRYHSWVISNDDFPNTLKITATDDNNQIMSIKHQNYNVYGVQYHPESILTTHGKEIITNFLDI